MSDPGSSRRTDVEIFFDGVDISKSIRDFFLSLTWTDSLEDESDDLEIQIEDRDQLWMGKWLAAVVDTAASPYQAASGGKTGVWTVTPKIGLNVRAGPGTDAKKLGALTCGTEVTPSSIEDGWAKIDYGGKTAYVCAAYLKEAGTTTASGDAGIGLSIRAAILRQNWKSDGKDDRLDCGSFTLDSIDAAGPPDTITFRAAALASTSPIRDTARSKSWEGYRLSGIAKEVAGKYGLNCQFHSDYDPLYERREQSRESDIAFLSKLCKDAAITLKATDQALILLDAAAFEEIDPVLTIQRGDGSYTSRQLQVGSASTGYRSCRVSYTDPKTGSCVEAVETVPDWDEEQDAESRRLEIIAPVRSIAEAQVLAKRHLRMANQYAKTASFSMPGDPRLAAGVTVLLDGWGPWSGKYIVTQAVHRVGGGGYTTEISLRACLDGY